MKLLLDENLSRRLVPFLQSDYPGTTQVCLIGLDRASDKEIWGYARDHDLVIVTRDADFEELSALKGMPPQVIWLRASNPSKQATLNLLIKNRELLAEALETENVACVELGGSAST